MKACQAQQHGGDYKAYARWGCRCPAARRARKIYQAQADNGTFQREYVDATGTRRRIHALAAIGYGQSQISERTGFRRVQLAHFTRWPKVHRDVAKVIAELYEELSHLPAPDSPAARQIRGQARLRGWASPLAWDDIDDPNAMPQLPEDTGAVDWVAVQRRLTGEKVKLNQAERAEVARRLAAMSQAGMGRLKIAARTGIHPRTIERYISEGKKAA